MAFLTNLVNLTKKIYHVGMTVVMLVPLLLTMGMNDIIPTDVIEYETTNPHIVSYGEMEISAHRSGAGIAPQNTLMAFEKVLKDNDKFGVDI